MPTGACHGAQQAPIFTSFQTISAGTSVDPKRYVTGPGSKNVLVTKAAANATTHNNVAYFSETEMQAIIKWIDSGK